LAAKKIACDYLRNREKVEKKRKPRNTFSWRLSSWKSDRVGASPKQEREEGRVSDNVIKPSRVQTYVDQEIPVERVEMKPLAAIRGWRCGTFTEAYANPGGRSRVCNRD
jgi:hypothetical protein